MKFFDGTHGNSGGGIKAKLLFKIFEIPWATPGI